MASIRSGSGRHRRSERSRTIISPQFRKGDRALFYCSKSCSISALLNAEWPASEHSRLYSIYSGLVGRATTFVGGDVGSIPTCGALEVWQWTFGSRTGWMVNKSAGQPQFFYCTASLSVYQNLRTLEARDSRNQHVRSHHVPTTFITAAMQRNHTNRPHPDTVSNGRILAEAMQDMQHGYEARGGGHGCRSLRRDAAVAATRAADVVRPGGVARASAQRLQHAQGGAGRVLCGPQSPLDHLPGHERHQPAPVLELVAVTPPTPTRDHNHQTRHTSHARDIQTRETRHTET
jgi:hypothetical protein